MALPASFADEAWRHIPCLLLEFVGRPQHKCDRCINAFANTCRTAPLWSGDDLHDGTSYEPHGSRRPRGGHDLLTSPAGQNGSDGLQGGPHDGSYIDPLGCSDGSTSGTPSGGPHGEPQDGSYIGPLDGTDDPPGTHDSPHGGPRGDQGRLDKDAVKVKQEPEKEKQEPEDDNDDDMSGGSHGGSEDSDCHSVIMRVFQKFDLDSDGVLNNEEFRNFSKIFFNAEWNHENNDTDEEWAETFNEICQDYEESPKKGISMNTFEDLLREDHDIIDLWEIIRHYDHGDMLRYIHHEVTMAILEDDYEGSNGQVIKDTSSGSHGGDHGGHHAAPSGGIDGDPNGGSYGGPLDDPQATPHNNPSWRPLWASWRLLGPSWRHLGRLGAILGASWTLLGASWAVLAASCAVLGASWAVLAASCAVLGPSWPPLGAVLRLAGAVLGASGAVLEPSWAVLGASWAVLGPSWAVLGPSWGPLGPSWGRLGALGPT